MYGMPQNNAYAAYGFAGYGGGFPNAAGTGTEGAGGLAGMPQAAAGLGQQAAMMPEAAGGADTSMAAGGWGSTADQTAAQQAYYQQYYGQ